MRVESPVGFAKLQVSVGTRGDIPAVFVEVPVVKPAEEDEIVQIGGSAFRPVNNMVDLKPVGVVTSGEPADPTVTMMNQTS